MALSQLINEYYNFSIPKNTTEEESDRLLSERTKLKNRINTALSVGKWCCSNHNYNCPFESNDLDEFLQHEIKCYDLEITYNDLCRMIDEKNLRARVPESNTCKYCLTTFKTKNLLSQHKNRGKPKKCVAKTLQNLVAGLSVDDQIYYINHIRNKMNTIS